MRAPFTAFLSLMLAAPAMAQENIGAPWSQADAHYDPAAMQAARRQTLEEHGAGVAYYALGDRLEYQSREGAPLLLFDGQGWWGGDRNKLLIKNETEFDLDEKRIEESEVQALWSRAITRYFDLQAGLARDFGDGPNRTHAVLGVQGLAPYWFEVDAAVFLSAHGEATARIEAEYEILFTQRLILQPRAELEFSAQRIEERGIGSGLTHADLGLRLRYEIDRQLAPYIGVSWSCSVGETADIARAREDDPIAASLVAGIRFWF